MSKILFSQMKTNKIFHFLSILCKVNVKFCFFILFLILSLNFDVFSQQISYPKHQVGLGYSSFSGAGLNYQIEINKHSALQASLLPYYTSKSSDEMDIIGVFGAEFQQNFFRTNQQRYYLFAGAGISHLEDRSITKKIINDLEIIEKNITTNRIYNFGFGAGIEYKFSPRVSTGFGLGLLYQISDKSKNSEFWDRNPTGESFLGLGASLSIRYVF